METIYDLEPDVTLIPAGEFLMGSDPGQDTDAEDRELPKHCLHLPDYYVGRTAVTNAQYAAFVHATDCVPPEHWQGESPPESRADHPVIYVSWRDALAYCNWLAQVTGKPYRLPSEAEWEKGARGTDGRIYPWGDQWGLRRCNTKEAGLGDTTPAGAYPAGASPFGLLDMAGNVWEWTTSLLWNYPYRVDDGRENLESLDLRVLRGGSFRNPARMARATARPRHRPDIRLRHLGFRVARPASS